MSGPDVARALRALTGSPPPEFRVGARVEVLMLDFRLVRGMVVRAGQGMAQLQVGLINAWTDRHGHQRPGYPHLVLIAYDDVKATRQPGNVAPDGNWLHADPRRDATEAMTQTPWKAFKP